jgi:hypothetical protein
MQARSDSLTTVLIVSNNKMPGLIPRSSNKGNREDPNSLNQTPFGKLNIVSSYFELGSPDPHGLARKSDVGSGPVTALHDLFHEI